MSARIAEATALPPSSFCKRYRSSYETPSPSSSLTLPVWKRYRGTSVLILDTKTKDESSDSDAEKEGHGLNEEGHSLEDEGHGSEKEEEAAPEDQQQAVLVVDTTASEPLGLGYEALRRCELALGEGSMPNTFEAGQSSRSVPKHEGVERISAFRQPTLVTWVAPEDGRVYTDIPTYVPPVAPLELHRSILHDHTQRLDALPPTLFEDYDRDLRELYTSAIWRPILALEAWAGQTDAQRAALWHAIYDIQRENHDLRRQIAEERHERLELTDRVARIERRHESGGE
ncbi:hypothetical protein Tco_0345748 [Tanacetum coccineum]